MVLRGVESSLARVRRIGAQRVYGVCAIAPPAFRCLGLLVPSYFRPFSSKAASYLVDSW